MSKRRSLTAHLPIDLWKSRVWWGLPDAPNQPGEATGFARRVAESRRGHVFLAAVLVVCASLTLGACNMDPDPERRFVPPLATDPAGLPLPRQTMQAETPGSSSAPSTQSGEPVDAAVVYSGPFTYWDGDCKVDGSATLRIEADRTAALHARFPGAVYQQSDGKCYYRPEKAGEFYGFSLTGTRSADGTSIDFTSCNDGSFTASGETRIDTTSANVNEVCDESTSLIDLKGVLTVSH
jgi:hypothetical protein